MKILRLSFFNIKRRKREAAILILLSAIAMTLMSIAIINYGKAYTLLEQAFWESESKEYAFVFAEKNYRTEFGDLIENDPRVMNVSKFELLRADDNPPLADKRMVPSSISTSPLSRRKVSESIPIF